MEVALAWCSVLRGYSDRQLVQCGRGTESSIPAKIKLGDSVLLFRAFFSAVVDRLDATVYSYTAATPQVSAKARKARLDTGSPYTTKQFGIGPIGQLNTSEVA